MKKIKKKSLAAGLGLALLAGVALSPGLAHATATDYLGTPKVTGSPVNANSFEITLTSFPGGATTNLYITPNSAFGNTFINPGPGYSAVTISNSSPVPTSDLLYSASGLDLQYVTSLTSDWSQTGATSSSGQVISSVYKIGSTPTMAGAVPGELVFTYQFDVTSLNPSTANGVNEANIALFNDPNGYNWALGDGAISDPQDLTGPVLSCAGCTTASLGSLYGSTYLDTSNGTVNSIQYTDNLPVGYYGNNGFNPQVSPIFFVATNAFSFTTGSIALGAGGTGGNVTVFVPDTPEPGTLVLFGTTLGLVAFMALRRRGSQRIA